MHLSSCAAAGVSFFLVRALPLEEMVWARASSHTPQPNYTPWRTKTTRESRVRPNIAHCWAYTIFWKVSARMQYAHHHPQCDDSNCAETHLYVYFIRKRWRRRLGFALWVAVTIAVNLYQYTIDARRFAVTIARRSAYTYRYSVSEPAIIYVRWYSRYNGVLSGCGVSRSLRVYAPPSQVICIPWHWPRARARCA